MVGVPARQIGWMSAYGGGLTYLWRGKGNGSVPTVVLATSSMVICWIASSGGSLMQFIDLKAQQRAEVG